MVLAEECKGTMTSTEIPCTLFLPYTDTCTDLYVSIYNTTSIIYETQMEEYTPFLCNATFNISEVGSYVFNYSTGDSGSIIVENDDDMMLAITIGIGIFAGLLLFLAFKLDESHFIMKLIMTFMAISSLVIIPVTYITGDTGVIFHKLTLGFFVLFWIYVSVYFFYYIMKKMQRTIT